MSDDEFSSDGDVNKRSYHNLLERKRRDHIKDSFAGLREALPSFKVGKGDKPRASRAQILRQTADYIHSCKKKVRVDSREIEHLKRENAKMEEAIRVIDAATESGDFDAAAPFVDAFLLKEERGYSSSSSSVQADDEDADRDTDEDEDVDEDVDITTDSDDSKDYLETEESDSESAVDVVNVEDSEH